MSSAGVNAAGQTAGHDAQPAGQQQQRQLQWQVTVTMDYWLYLPPDYEQRDAWPLLLFLHGAGERGSDLNLVQRHGPPRLINEGREFPFVVVSPQCPAGRWWDPFELAALVDAIVQQHRIDESRLYVTGLSMGGFGTWALAAHQPQRFAAIAPICGGGEPIVARLVASTPAWVFHGAKDPVVPVERSRQMVQAMENAGGQVRFTIYPDAGHDAWTETYANPELYEWLLQHQRTPPN